MQGHFWGREQEKAGETQASAAQALATRDGEVRRVGTKNLRMGTTPESIRQDEGEPSASLLLAEAWAGLAGMILLW